MKKLESDWFTQNCIDAEYQKYVLMAYLQAVRQNFTENKLYPDLPDLRGHYETGVRFSRGKGTLNAAFPKRIQRVIGNPPRIEYKSETLDDEYMNELDAIMTFALPRFQTTLTEGQQRWTEIANTLTLAPIGLLPIRPEEGYLLIHTTNRSESQIYHFCLTLYSEGEPGGRMIRFRFMETFRRTLTNTFENVKLDLIRRHRNLPNPATYILESEYAYPVQETLLPIAKQLLAQAAA